MKKSNPLYKCYKMDWADFKTAEPLVEATNFRSLKTSKISEIEFNKEWQTLLKCKLNYADQLYEVDMSNRAFDELITGNALSNARNGKQKLKSNKIDGLKYLIDKKVIPPNNQNHYRNCML